MRVENTLNLDQIKTNIEGEAGKQTGSGQAVMEAPRYFSLDGHSVAKTGVDKTGSASLQSLEDIQNQAEAVDLDALQTQMAVLSNTLTPQDYQKLQEEGFPPTTEDVETVVTVLDQIKIKLMEAGIDISYFGDMPSHDEIVEMAGSLTVFTEGQKAHFIRSEEPITLGNAYRSQFAFAGETGLGEDGAFTEKATAMPAELAESFAKLEGQVLAIVEEAGLPRAIGFNDAKWLFAHDLPITEENLQKLDAMNRAELPMSEEKVAEAVAKAMLEGAKAEDALIIEGSALIDRAQNAFAVIENAEESDLDKVLESGKPLTIQNLKKARAAKEIDARKVTDSEEVKNQVTSVSLSISYTYTEISQVTARRQLEEARLVMSVQANFSLLKQGISIETQPLEDLIKDLKEVEQSFFRQMMENNGVEPSEENLSLMSETSAMVESLKTMPAAVLGTEAPSTLTVQSLYQASLSVKAQLSISDGNSSYTQEVEFNESVTSAVNARISAQASSSYETLMTSPRSDLGDSFSKAFQNVDAILEDLGMETNPENERAVRILGYNSQEIRRESVIEMRLADSQVQSLLKNMTPSVTMHLIKEGIHPLNTPIDELNAEISQIREENGYGEEDFAEYLWNLEHSEGIEEKDRDAYIGIYRLIHQVEKSDGAVIGALVKQGAELTLNNLLTSVKNRQNRGIDVTVDQSFGNVEEVAFTGKTIASQLANGFGGENPRNLHPEQIRSMLEQNQVTAEEGEAFLGEKTLDQVDAMLAEASQRTESKTGQVQFGLAMEDIEKAADIEENVLQMMKDMGVSSSVSNMIATQEYFQNRNQMYRRIFGVSFESEEGGVDFEALKEECLARFAEGVKSPTELAEAQEKLAEVAEYAMKNMLPPDDKVTSLDVRELKQLQTQFSLSSRFAANEHYAIPVMVADEMATVHLQIVHGRKEKGKVNIVFDTETFGKISAQISDLGDRIDGLLLSDRGSRESLGTIAQKLSEELSSTEKTAQIHSAVEKSLNLTDIELGNAAESQDRAYDREKRGTSPIRTDELYRYAKLVIDLVVREGRTL